MRRYNPDNLETILPGLPKLPPLQEVMLNRIVLQYEAFD